MTNKEAIERLQRCKRNLELGKVIGAVSEEGADERIEAYDLAIKALEEYRPQGKWINHRNDYGHNIADCSLCGKAMQWHDEDEDGIPRYCWYCGASMKGKLQN